MSCRENGKKKTTNKTTKKRSHENVDQKKKKLYGKLQKGSRCSCPVPSSINIYFEDTTLHFEQKQIPSEKVIEQIGEKSMSSVTRSSFLIKPVTVLYVQPTRDTFFNALSSS